MYTYTTLGQADINDHQCGTSTIEVDDFPETVGFPHGQLTLQQKILQLIPSNHVTQAVLLLVKRLSCHCARFLAIIHVYFFKDGHVLGHWRFIKSSLQVQKPPGYRYQQAPFLCLKSFLEALGLPLSSSLCLLKILVITPKKTATILLVLYSEEKPKSEVDFRGAWCAILISRLFSHWLRIFKLQLFWLMLGVPVRARARKHSDTVPCWWEVHQKHSIDIWLVGAEPHISGVTKICLTPRP